MMSSLPLDQAAAMTVEDVSRACRTSLHAGLTSDEARHRLSLHGPNTFDINKDEPLWKKYLGQVSIKLEPCCCLNRLQKFEDR